MKLKIGRYECDWSTQFFRNIEHRGGVVALALRHNSGELEILDACATGDMNRTAQGFLDAARRHRDQPGVVVGLLTVASGRDEGIRIADSLLDCRWVRAAETDQWTRDNRDVVSRETLAEIAHDSAIRAIYGYLP